MLTELLNQIGIWALIGGGLLLWLTIKFVRSLYMTVISVVFTVFGIMRLMTILNL